MRAVYCKCLNTYSIECKTNPVKGCETPEYWKQGIGRINAIEEDEE
jgi:hypothetical protein|tara:strand:+ start:498 stop:635 length:138 start_codon:yes stop_codon:yes gene_type:complete